MPDFKYAGSVSHGTMRSEDLIPKFLEALQELDPENLEISKQTWEIPSDVRSWEVFCEDRPNDADGFLDSLFDDLDRAAPEGFYFGSHPGNDSDYGFWEVEPLDPETVEQIESALTSYEGY